MSTNPWLLGSSRKCRGLLSRFEECLTKQKWIFLHLPKCGGTSISSALQRALGAGTEGFVDPVKTRSWARFDLPDREDAAEGSEALFRTRLNLFREYVDRKYPLIFGHFPLDPMTFDKCDDYRWLTVLRDPAKRVLSQFKYHVITRKPSIATDLAAVRNLWKQYLDSDLARFHCNLYAYYLGGHPYGFQKRHVAEMRQHAKDTLHRFTIKGEMENLEEVSHAFLAQTGCDIRFDRKNSLTSNSNNPKSASTMKKFTASVEESKLRDLCAGDAEIYQIVSK